MVWHLYDSLRHIGAGENFCTSEEQHQTVVIVIPPTEHKWQAKSAFFSKFYRKKLALTELSAEVKYEGLQIRSGQLAQRLAG